MFSSAAVTQSAIGYVTSLSLDVSVFAVISITLSLIGLRVGKNFLVALLLSLFTALQLLSFFPSIEKVSFFNEPILGKYDLNIVLIYIGFSTLLYFILRQIIDTEFPDTTIRIILNVIILSIVNACMFLSGLHILQAVVISSPPTFIDTFFQIEGYIFAWLLGVLGALFIATR